MHKIFSCVLVFFLALALTVCEDPENEVEESRLYLGEESPNYFTELYVVESPQGSNGNWGQNIINNYTTLPGYGWKKYTFSPGTYDIKIRMYLTNIYSNPHTEYGQIATDGHGRKYEAASSGYLYITDFAFDH